MRWTPRQSGVFSVALFLAMLVAGLCLVPVSRYDGALLCAVSVMALPCALGLVIRPRAFVRLPDAESWEWTRFSRVIQVLSFVTAVAVYANVRAGA
jgi:hypothetical protein